jgi:hypothetical protein
VPRCASSGPSSLGRWKLEARHHVEDLQAEGTLHGIQPKPSKL